jgi:hypothetical protein
LIFYVYFVGALVQYMTFLYHGICYLVKSTINLVSTPKSVPIKFSEAVKQL